MVIWSMIAWLQDPRTGEIVIPSGGDCIIIDKLDSFAQSTSNLLQTWKGSDLDALEYGPDWRLVLTTTGAEDPTPYIVMEMTRVLVPKNDPRIANVTGIHVQEQKENERKYYLAYAQISSIDQKTITVMQRVSP